MLLALDYDGTYTADPALWNRFIEDARRAGHRVVVVTIRDEPLMGAEVKNALAHRVERIVFTDRKAKQPFALALGLKVDVWIDDNPKRILTDKVPR